MGWATIADVLQVTGKTVTEAELLPADSTITLYSNRSPDASGGMNVRDLYWMKAATCWQAVWEQAQVEPEGRQSVRFGMTDGQSANYRGAHELVLAPRAARALRNLSWMGARTLNIPNRFIPLSGNGVTDFNVESSDDWTDWEVLEGVGD